MYYFFFFVFFIKKKKKRVRVGYPRELPCPPPPQRCAAPRGCSPGHVRQSLAVVAGWPVLIVVYTTRLYRSEMRRDCRPAADLPAVSDLPLYIYGPPL